MRLGEGGGGGGRRGIYIHTDRLAAVPPGPLPGPLLRPSASRLAPPFPSQPSQPAQPQQPNPQQPPHTHTHPQVPCGGPSQRLHALTHRRCGAARRGQVPRSAAAQGASAPLPFPSLGPRAGRAVRVCMCSCLCACAHACKCTTRPSAWPRAWATPHSCCPPLSHVARMHVCLSACVQVYDKAECVAMGMGCFVGVAEASEEPLKFVHLKYTPKGGCAGGGREAPEKRLAMQLGVGSCCTLGTHACTHQQLCARPRRPGRRLQNVGRCPGSRLCTTAAASDGRTRQVSRLAARKASPGLDVYDMCGRARAKPAGAPGGTPLRKVAIVGKGLTFDSGGYNIKVSESSRHVLDSPRCCACL